MSFNFMTAVTIHSDLGAQENKICHHFHFSPSTCHEVMGPDAIIFVFWMLSFKPDFHSPLFTLTKPLFSSSSLSAIRVISSEYLRLLIFLLANLITACHPSRLASWVMYYAQNLIKNENVIALSCSFPNCEPVHCSCLVLIVASWPVQISHEAGRCLVLPSLWEYSSVCWHTFKTECHFCFGPATSFFLELLLTALHPSSVS